jgi:integrase
VPKKIKLRSLSLTDEEAGLILSETLRAPDPRASRELVDARRWIPWIMAYSGARVNEITQLQGQDIFPRTIGNEEVWVIRITPDAGPVKTGEARDFPIHPHIVEQGFIQLVKRKGRGPLFYDPSRRRDGSDENPLSNQMGESLAAWVRSLGVDGVAPNHGWRHRFKTVAKRVRMDPEIRDAIQGHAPRTEGEKYGEVPLEAMWTEILRLPRYEVAPPVGPKPVTERSKEASRKRMETAKRAKTKRQASAERQPTEAHAD